MKTESPLSDGSRVEIEVQECSDGGVTVEHSIITADEVRGEVTVTCTCTDTDGKKYTVTKKCPKEGNTCSCADPKNPKITCS